MVAGATAVPTVSVDLGQTVQELERKLREESYFVSEEGMSPPTGGMGQGTGGYYGNDVLPEAAEDMGPG